MPKVKVNDIEIYYEVHGEGEPLVLLHGFLCTSQQWNHFIPEFQERYQLIIPDLRGHGRTTNPRAHLLLFGKNRKEKISGGSEIGV